MNEFLNKWVLFLLFGFFSHEYEILQKKQSLQSLKICYENDWQKSGLFVPSLYLDSLLGEMFPNESERVEDCMEALVKKKGDVTIISIRGALTIEETQPLRDACLKHFLGKKVIFNLEKANFVGSTGLQAFMDTIKAFDQKSEHGVRFVAARSEFRRMITNLEARRIEFFEDEVRAATEWPLLFASDSVVNLSPDLIFQETEE